MSLFKEGLKMSDHKTISITVVRGDIAILQVFDRENFLDLMLSIKKNYTKNNQISSLFVEAIPDTEEIIIYADRNEEMEIPFVVLKSFDGDEKAIKIPRCHKIIWSVLTEFTKYN